MRMNLPVTQREYELQDGQAIVSKTDTHGNITYVNPYFIEVSGFAEEELLGAPQNLVRHPDMPVEAFADMWATLKDDRPWTGLVKNRRKNGDHYWVLANVTPVRENGVTVGYMSVRGRPDRAAVQAAEAAYRELRENPGCGLMVRNGRIARSGWRGRLGTLTRLRLSTRIDIPRLRLRATSGRVMVNGYNLGNIRNWQIPYMRRTLGVIFQDFRLIDKKTVRQNLEFAMRVIGASRREMRRRIPYVLDLVGLKEKLDVHPDELSGGEQQRVAIARALINNPQMIIADEPTGNLDPQRSLEIMTLLERINSMGTTMLVVTHEKELVNRFSKRVVAIEEGRMISDGQGGYYKHEEED